MVYRIPEPTATEKVIDAAWKVVRLRHSVDLLPQTEDAHNALTNLAIALQQLAAEQKRMVQA